MEDVFSSNSLNIIQKKIEVVEKNGDEKLKENLGFYFDIEKVVEWVKENKFNRIALQFPDELLNSSIKINALLNKHSSSDSCVYFILADTSYGSCCVDLVAAEHYNADAIVHFGHSCLSPVEKLPVFYVFEKHPLHLGLIYDEVEAILNADPNESLILLYDVSYYYLYDEIKKKFSDNSKVYLSNIYLKNSQIKHLLLVDEKILFSRILPSDLNEKSRKGAYSFFYIGSRQSFITPFTFYFNKNKFYHLNPSVGRVELVQFRQTNKELMKRYYLIEKARDASIFGILIGTMSVANYRDAVDHVSRILREAKRRYYSFLIGKLNCPKLNNFMEVDLYVLIACNENSLINSKELNKPIVTVYELEMAFNCARLWGEEFICDYRQLLEGSEHHLKLRLSELEADVSLISNSTRMMAINQSREQVNKEEKNKSLINRDEALALIHHSGAGEFLQGRSWTGLEQALGQTPVTKPVEGQKGIAMSYNTEPLK